MGHALGTEEVGWGFCKGRRGYRALDTVDKNTAVIDQRQADAVAVDLEQGRISSGATEVDIGRGTTSGPAVRPLAGQFLDEALNQQVGHDCGDAGVAEPGETGEGGPRLRPLSAQTVKDQSPVLTPDAVAIADGSRHTLLSCQRP